MIVISDTSPITNLLQIGAADLLRQLYEDVLIPEAVQSELLTLHPSLPPFLRCEPIRNVQAVERLLGELDLGEAEAIVLALERNADLLLMDESDGRRVALREKLRFTGLVGVLIESKRRGLISSLNETLNKLEKETTFFISKDIKNAALKAAKEA